MRSAVENSTQPTSADHPCLEPLGFLPVTGVAGVCLGNAMGLN